MNYFMYKLLLATKALETELQTTIWNYEKDTLDVPVVIIDEMKDALNHVSKAIDILEWDDE